MTRHDPITAKYVGVPFVAVAVCEARADERRKVIAGLTEPMRNGEEPEIVQEVMEVMAAEYGASGNQTAHAVLERIASLLAHEGEGIEAPIETPTQRNAKLLPSDPGEKNIVHKSAASPSSEPARAGDAELREAHFRAALEEIAGLDAGNYSGLVAVRLATNALAGCDDDGNDLPGFDAYEKGSTHG